MPPEKKWRAAVPINIGDQAFGPGDLLPAGFKVPKMWIERGSVTPAKRKKGAR